MWSFVRCQELWQTCQHLVFVHISHGSLFSSVSLEKKIWRHSKLFHLKGRIKLQLAPPLSSQGQPGRKQRASRVATSDGSISDALQFLLCTWSEQFINLGVVGNRTQHLINVSCLLLQNLSGLCFFEWHSRSHWLHKLGGSPGRKCWLCSVHFARMGMD